jgi:hypothetical protein
MYSYFAYGLGIRSALHLPELESEGQRAKGKELGAGSGEQGANVSSDLRPLISDLWRSAGSGELGISDFEFRIADLGNDKEQGAGNRELGAGSKRAKGKERRAKSGEQGTGSKEAEPDVKICFGRVDRLPSGAAVEGSYFRSSPEETQLFWEDVGTIQVRGGREITIDPVPGVEEDLLRLVILGPVLGALLQQRGHLVLHGSVVAMADGAVAFLGEKGWGKSTVAASLYSCGYGIVADDIAAVDVSTGCPMLQVGFPQLKLWPDTAVSLGYTLETLPRLHSRSDKRACRIDRSFSPAPLPLKAVYVLAQGSTPKLEPLPFGKAFLELVRHSYRVELLGASGAPSHFLQCASIIKSTRMRYLKIPRSLSILPDVARLVEEDITCPQSSQRYVNLLDSGSR